MKSLFGIGVQLVGLASNLPNETRVLLVSSSKAEWFNRGVGLVRLVSI